MRDVHGSGYQQAPEGKGARRFLACARRCEVQSQVFEHLFAPLHGVFVPRCAPGMAKMLFLALFFIANFSFPDKRRAVQESRACWSLAVVHLYHQTQDLSNAVATVMQ